MSTTEIRGRKHGRIFAFKTNTAAKKAKTPPSARSHEKEKDGGLVAQRLALVFGSWPAHLPFIVADYVSQCALFVGGVGNRQIERRVSLVDPGGELLLPPLPHSSWDARVFPSKDNKEVFVVGGRNDDHSPLPQVFNLQTGKWSVWDDAVLKKYWESVPRLEKKVVHVPRTMRILVFNLKTWHHMDYCFCCKQAVFFDLDLATLRPSARGDWSATETHVLMTGASAWRVFSLRDYSERRISVGEGWINNPPSTILEIAENSCFCTSPKTTQLFYGPDYLLYGPTQTGMTCAHRPFYLNHIWWLFTLNEDKFGKPVISKRMPCVSDPEEWPDSTPVDEAEDDDLEHALRKTANAQWHSFSVLPLFPSQLPALLRAPPI